MTDKQIIINGVDVSGCEYYNKDDKTCREVNGNYDTDICEFDKCENSNCHYKQLKRKEQECEKLKKRLESFQKNYSKLYQVVENKGYIKELDQLKAENDKLKQTLDKIENIIKGYCKNMCMAGTKETCDDCQNIEILNIINKAKDNNYE